MFFKELLFSFFFRFVCYFIHHLTLQKFLSKTNFFIDFSLSVFLSQFVFPVFWGLNIRYSGLLQQLSNWEHFQTKNLLNNSFCLAFTLFLPTAVLAFCGFMCLWFLQYISLHKIFPIGNFSIPLSLPNDEEIRRRKKLQHFNAFEIWWFIINLLLLLAIFQHLSFAQNSIFHELCVCRLFASSSSFAFVSDIYDSVFRNQCKLSKIDFVEWGATDRKLKLFKGNKNEVAAKVSGKPANSWMCVCFTSLLILAVCTGAFRLLSKIVVDFALVAYENPPKQQKNTEQHFL